MAKYKKRADGRYQANIKIGVRENGKPKYKTFYGRTQKEIDDKIVDYKSLMNKGIIVDDKNMTIGAWADTWLRHYDRVTNPARTTIMRVQ
jgi:hypothetical protein